MPNNNKEDISEKQEAKTEELTKDKKTNIDKNKKNTNDKQQELIYDEEINLNKEGNDLLGTKVYADILYDKLNNIKNCNKFVTIGLFGGWGSGKSSIIKTLMDRLKEEDSKNKEKRFLVMKYDAWKYSNDSFRRSFILDMMKEFHIKGAEKTKLLMQYDSTKEKTSFSLKIVLIIVSILFLLIIIYGIIYIYNLQTMSIADKLQVFSLVIASLAFFFGSFFNKKVTQTEKISLPEQFEEIFNKIIDELIKENSNKSSKKNNYYYKKQKTKIVIIIDNIDRCEPEISKELLSTVKNFFNNDNCIFIIPIDDRAIKKHLNYKNNEDREEFLRKFFDLTIRIKDFSYYDFFPFTKKLIDKYNFNILEDKSKKIARLISREFCKNPRRIIQFVNNLYTEIQLAKKLESDNIFSNILNNIRFL